MAIGETSVDTAISLMKAALVLLDEAEEDLAAARLQHAIDTAENVPIASSADFDEHFPLPDTHDGG